MGSLLRSEPMTLIQIIEAKGAARDVVNTLGDLGAVQFRDLNAGVQNFKRSFAGECKRCDEMARRLDFLLNEVVAAGLTPLPRDEEAHLAPIPDLDSNLKQTHEEMRAMKANEVEVLRSHNALKEHLLVLQAGGGVLHHGRSSPSKAAEMEEGLQLGAGDRDQLQLGPSAPMLPAPGQDNAVLTCLAGTVPRSKAATLARSVHRVSRGNVVVTEAPLDEELLDSNPRDPQLVAKNFFMLFSSGAVLRAKLAKLTAHLGATLYPYPEEPSARQAALRRLQDRLTEMGVVLETTRQHRRHLLQWVSQQWAYWRYTVSREQATLGALNRLNFDLSRKVFVAEGWVATPRLAEVRAALHRATIRTGSETEPILNELRTTKVLRVPPTHLPTTRISAGFQALVDTYGVPRYREINPGVFAIVLFPFLFGIMFGDVGHGLLLVMLALYFIRNEQQLQARKLDDMLAMAFGGRYVLLLNGIFSMYVGLLYNEAFSVPMGLFRSTYTVSVGGGGAARAEWDGTVYPFGIDPMWHLAANKMTFFNSFKMKASIVVGVLQMALGILLSFLNHREFGDRRAIWFVFVPELVFFLSIFGYLVLMIFLKWATDWVAIAQQPPSLLNTLISMFMAPGVYTEESRLFAGQEHLQLGLVCMALLAVPPLLLGKPLLALREHRRKVRERAYSALAQAAEQSEQSPPEEARGAGPSEGGVGPARGAGGEETEEEPEFEFMEVMVHQVIHTIEFVLGSISNTASYLRLWALSLAHSQLSELFWEKVMRGGFSTAASLPVPLNGAVIFVCLAIWLVLNLGVLMVMENLSSFLHALRLQWVEFQNKFYNGDGSKFVPFSFANLDKGGEMD